MITPILNDPKPHGGTLYTFPSAGRDLTRSFSNSEYEFAFSHFACLNLPDFRYGKFENNDIKGVYLDNLIKYYYTKDSSDNLFTKGLDNSGSDTHSLLELVGNDLNKCLKWHMQSYVMNHEIAILNGYSLENSGGYDNTILKTPTERIFFNWLERIGAIKFNGNSETLEGYSNPNENKPSKTVQYIGTIDMINNVNIGSDSFNEIYLNIPASAGASKDVKFNKIYDNNYEESGNVEVPNGQYIIGRDPEHLGYDISLNALYDSECDLIEDENGRVYPVYGLDGSSPFYKNKGGYCIDFNDNQYSEGSIERMNLSSTDDFEFNCVLIYYRIRKGNEPWQTNLYGVLFLEEAISSDLNTNINQDDERVGYIQRYPKFKNGNSWGLKLDLKIDAQPDSQLELRDGEYTDPNGGAGMQMFTEALIQLNDCVRIFYEVKEENAEIEERLYKLENIVSGVDTVYDLRDEVSILRTRIETFKGTIDFLNGKVETIEGKMDTFERRLGSLIEKIDGIVSGNAN